MARNKYGKTRTIPHRRKRENRTNYKKRLSLLKSGQARLVVRKSLNTITAQIVAYGTKGDKVLAAATSKDLDKLGWKMHKGNMPSAYLTGLLLGSKAKKNKVKSAVLDLGLQIPIKRGKLYATVKGVIDAGLTVNCGEDALPSDDRVSGQHIADYAAKLKETKDAYDRQFSARVKQGVKPEDATKLFEETKKKILSA